MAWTLICWHPTAVNLKVNIESNTFISSFFSDDSPLSSDSSRFNGISNGSVSLAKNSTSVSSSSKGNAAAGSNSSTSSISISPKNKSQSKCPTTNSTRLGFFYCFIFNSLGIGNRLGEKYARIERHT